MISTIHVFLDATSMPAARAGVGRYIEGILRGLSTQDVRLTVAVQRSDRHAIAAIVPSAVVHAAPRLLRARPIRFLWEQLRLPVLARRAGADVIHSPHYTFPLSWTGGRVVTVHDATFFSDPLAHGPVKRVFFRRWTRLAWKLSDVVVTPSRATANEVTRFLGPPRGLIEVALLGANTQTFHPPSPAELSAFRDLVGLAGGAEWFAFLGTIEPRKNLTALLEAFQLAKEKSGRTPLLLISGGRGWDKTAVAALDALAPDSGVIELGYLPIGQLSALLGGSLAVLYPSLGEGFGLPVLEAMSCEAIVITTDRLAIPEVGGDAVVYAGVDAQSIADAMVRVMAGGEGFAQLRIEARERASTFTWNASAARHLSAYQASLPSVP